MWPQITLGFGAVLSGATSATGRDTAVCRSIEERKELLTQLLRGSNASIVLNQHHEGDGEIVFSLACKLVSKRPGSIYRRGDHRFGSRSKIRLRQR